MKIILFLFSFLTLFASKLHMVIEIFRHGAREPLSKYFKPNFIPSLGELTPVGMRQHFILG